METVPVRYEESFIKDMERVMKKHRYATRAEFIREAVRDKIKELETQEALLRLDQISGTSQKHTTKERLRAAKQASFAALARDIK